jgi:Flp pilus assembly protein TadG
MRLARPAPRRGAHLVECAFIFSLTMLLLAGLVIGAMGVMRYQQMAHLAREAARFAATHAGQYQKENAAAIAAGTLPNVDKSYLVTNVIQAGAVNLDPNLLSAAVTINTANGSFDWDDTGDTGGRWPYSTSSVNGTSWNNTNTVSVTLTYQWSPGWLIGDTVTMTSTAVVPISY